jgi:CRP-like cAMP-binding protein
VENYSENHLICSLPESARERIGPYLRKVLLPSQSILYEPGDLLTKAYFPEAGAISLVVVFSTGGFAETAMAGRDGMLGGFSALHCQRVSHRAVVQIRGAASVIDLDIVRRIARQHEPVMSMLIQHENALHAQAQQIAACNASHSLEARLCRWLLRASDASGRRTLFTTQERIAEMLGVKRTSVSLVAHSMQQAGLIRNRRAHLELVDITMLREHACECYFATANHYDHLTRPKGARVGVAPAELAFLSSSRRCGHPRASCERVKALAERPA